MRLLRDNHNQMDYSKLADALEIGKSTVSYHFKIMREAGLITITRHGQAKEITLNIVVFNGVLPGFLTSL
ncbi:hypothetical protein FC18_GL000805 [Lacticaseibacillus sharpeae JCM 1186 = DSM 20505]|uniref:HTH arsR-type domain-containing protein n=1 Tax=Lacticaseibacillus sharpeae JCM 1186 = DSM 20505 TaxID=1291052 RepID=A0A0R1ZNF3_9LACO|nr:hypothetical protein FC18_GL000805 [Lacticaseibacillus sharpeae JCM 1186 = DSM 20505]